MRVPETEEEADEAAAETTETPPNATRSRISVSARTKALVAASMDAPTDGNDDDDDETDAMQAV